MIYLPVDLWDTAQEKRLSLPLDKHSSLFYSTEEPLTASCAGFASWVTGSAGLTFWWPDLLSSRRKQRELYDLILCLPPLIFSYSTCFCIHTVSEEPWTIRVGLGKQQDYITVFFHLYPPGSYEKHLIPTKDRPGEILINALFTESQMDSGDPRRTGEDHQQATWENQYNSPVYRGKEEQ